MTTYTYDDLGRLLTQAAVTTSGTGNKTLTYTYTLTGQKASESDGTTTTSFAYDALNRLSTLCRPEICILLPEQPQLVLR